MEIKEFGPWGAQVPGATLDPPLIINTYTVIVSMLMKHVLNGF